MILEALFNGEIFPGEQVIPDTPEYIKENKEANDLMIFFENKLKAEDYERIEELRDHLATAQGIENEMHFQYGFSMGLVLMQEVYELLCRNMDR